MKTIKHKYETLRVRSNDQGKNPQGENRNDYSSIRFLQLFNRVQRKRENENE